MLLASRHCARPAHYTSTRRICTQARGHFPVCTRIRPPIVSLPSAGLCLLAAPTLSLTSAATDNQKLFAPLQGTRVSCVRTQSSCYLVRVLRTTSSQLQDHNQLDAAGAELDQQQQQADIKGRALARNQTGFRHHTQRRSSSSSLTFVPETSTLGLVGLCLAFAHI